MYFIIYDKEKILNIVATQEEARLKELFPNANYKRVENIDGIGKHYLDEFEDFENLVLKEPYERWKLGRLKIDESMTFDKDSRQMRVKTLKEKVDEGLVILNPDERVNEEDEVEERPWKELVSEGLRTFEDWLNEEVRSRRNQMLFDIDAIYLNPERWHFMSDEKKLEWSNYKQALRDFPETLKEVVDEVVFPEMPNHK